MKRKIFYLSLLIILSFTIFLTGIVLGVEKNQQKLEVGDKEIVTAIEMSDEEVDKYIREHIEMEKKKLPAGYTIIIKYDLHNPKGINKELLPEEYVIGKGNIVTDYTEWEVVKIKEVEVRSGNEVAPLGGYDCPVSYAGSRDSTESEVYSGITQYNRQFADKYKNYYTYWKLERTWGKWKRSSSSYDVKDCNLKIDLRGENCAGSSLSCIKSSYYFNPGWSGNETSWWGIWGCTDKIIRRYPTGGFTYTECDVYKNGSKIKDDFRTYNLFP